LKKKKMVAFQASPRGGIVRVEVQGNRILIGGQAVMIIKGELLI
jgi:predicted PhzF superfamily epimerase YddE/YHI9